MGGGKPGIVRRRHPKMRVPTKCAILVLAITLVASLATASQMEKYGCGGEANPLWRWVWDLTGSVPAFVIVSQTTTALLMVVFLKLRALEDARIQMILVGVASLSATNDLLSLANFSPFPLLMLIPPPLVAVGAGFCWSKAAKFDMSARQLPLFTLAAYGAFFLIMVIGASIPYHEGTEELPPEFSARIVEWLENNEFYVFKTKDHLMAFRSDMDVRVNFEDGVVKSVGTVTFTRRQFDSWSDFVKAYDENALFKWWADGES